jgi:hypothetical protein
MGPEELQAAIAEASPTQIKATVAEASQEQVQAAMGSLSTENRQKLNEAIHGFHTGSAVAVCVAFSVRVVDESGDELDYALPVGKRGVVSQIDAAGDAEIDFEGKRVWVFQKDFGNLSIVLDTGSIVTVRVAFSVRVVEDEPDYALPLGKYGVVTEIDAAGDAVIDFEGIRKQVWVFQKDFSNFKLEPLPDTGSIVTVRVAFSVRVIDESGDEHDYALPVGKCGVVLQIDMVGDANIDFKDKQVWVFQDDFVKLKSEAGNGKKELATVRETPPEYVDEVVASWSAQWYSPEPLKAAIGTGDTLFLDGNWLLTQAEQKVSLPMRQKLPEDAAIDTEAFLNSLFVDLTAPYFLDKENTYTVAVSYCWATKSHPDPTGEQLQRLKGVLKLMLKEVHALGIFLDWCGLYQGKRNAEQKEAFKRGLKNVNIWYAHPLTFVWALTVVPVGVKTYETRGWPRFEMAVSTLIKDSYMFLNLFGVEDLAEEDAGDLSYDDLQCRCTVQCEAARAPPMTPAAFSETLKTLSFTNGADRRFVLEKYEATFTEVMGCATRLDFSRFHSWGDSEMASLGEVLPWCPSVETMNLSYCPSITSIPASITKMKACTKLDLTSCEKLGSLPEGIGSMKAMKELHVTGCTSLAALPEGLGDLDVVGFQAA